MRSTLVLAGFIAGTAVVGGALIESCARPPRPDPTAAAEPTNPASLNGLASSEARPTTILESPTVSFALDRIDQHELPLDQTFAHSATGKGVTVYVFDGGVSPTHPELAGRVRIGYTGFSDDPKICNPHGTAVAGAIAGATLGVAPDAEIVDVKMVQCEKLRGTIKAIVDGAHWVIEDHKSASRVRRSRTGRSSPTRRREYRHSISAVAELRAAGIPVVVSAGNLEIDACRVSPANSLGTIVVGASARRIGRARRRHDAHDRSSRAEHSLRPVHRHLRAGRFCSAAESRPEQRADHAAVEWHVDVGRLRERRDRAVPRNAPERDAGRNRRGGRASATLNVLRDTKAPVSRMLYVGAVEMRFASRVATRSSSRH